jgi:hypothetical protein
MSAADRAREYLKLLKELNQYKGNKLSHIRVSMTKAFRQLIF